MSRYELTINGSPYSVEILDVSETHATVDVNGSRYQVEIGGGVAAPARRTEARTSPSAAARPAPAKPAPEAAPKPAAAPSPEGADSITAPMPGHILSVAVKEGDQVEVGDTVVVMEAMKMENEIKAHAAGTVTEVKVQKGQDVGVGEILLVIGG